MSIRIGQGIDIHRFKPGNHVKLGGVEIPFHCGLDGHSDADVLLHAVTDALLGATGNGDIGTFFPDTDPKWKDADSTIFLRHVYEKYIRADWVIENIDSTILAQAPRISPHVEQIKKNISSCLEIDVTSCGIKATTTEGLGFVGREEGIMAFSVALLRKREKR